MMKYKGVKRSFCRHFFIYLFRNCTNSFDGFGPLFTPPKVDTAGHPSLRIDIDDDLTTLPGALLHGQVGSLCFNNSMTFSSKERHNRTGAITHVKHNG